MSRLRVYSIARPAGRDAAGILEAAVEGIEARQIPLDGPVPDDFEGEVAISHARPTPALEAVLALGPRWVHLIGTGIEQFPFHLVQPGTVVTCGRGASAVAIAEWTVAMMLAFEKRLPDSWISEPPEQWALASLGILEGRTLGIIGFGGIGQRIARLALPFDMRVIATRHSDRPSEVPGVELVRDLGELLREADHLVVAAPATAATRHIIGFETLQQVKPGVHLVNVSRGWLVNQEALREALEDGRVACASLDTVEPEPLPAGHWLYTHPQVRLSAHISWMRPDVHERILDPAIENLRRYMAGEPLQGVVDLEAGY